MSYKDKYAQAPFTFLSKNKSRTVFMHKPID